MDPNRLRGLARVSEVQFEHASAELREIRGQIAECEARRSALLAPVQQPGGWSGGDLAFQAKAVALWRRWRADRIEAVQRDRAALAADEIEAREKAKRAFGRLTALRCMMDGGG